MADKSLIIRLITDASGAKAGFIAANTAAAQFGKKMERIGRDMSNAGDMMTRRLTVPIVAAGAASAKLAVDFEDSMSKIRGLVGASAGQMAKYESAVLRMAGRVGKAPKELADALYFITSSGASGALALDILDKSARAAAAGLGETQVVADALTSAINVYGKSNLSAAEAVDIMTAAVREGKMEPEEMAQNIGKVISMAKVMKVNFAEVSASLAAMSLAGIKTDEASVALNQFFTSLNKPSEKGVAALKKVDLSYAQLRDTLAKRGVVATMRTLTSAFEGNTEGLVAVLGNVRSAKAVLSTMGLSARQLDGIFRGVSGSAGDMNTAFKEAAQTSGFKLHQALAKLQTVGITIGKQVLPAVLRLAKWVGQLADRFGNLSPRTQDLILKLGLIVAAAGPLLSIFGRLVTVAGTLTRAFAIVKTAIVGVTAASRAAEATGFFAGGKWTATAAGVGRFGGALRAVPWVAFTAGVVAASRALGVFIQRMADKLAMKTMGMTRKELEKFQAVSESRFGGKAATEMNKVRAATAKVSGQVRSAGSELTKIGRMHPKPTVTIGGDPVGQARSIREQIARIFAQQIVQQIKTVVTGGVGFGVPKTAEGGVFSRPQVRLIGEAGPEAVVPLSANRSARAAQVMNEAGLGGLTINFNGDLIGVDATDLAHQVASIISRAQRSRSRGVAFA